MGSGWSLVASSTATFLLSLSWFDCLIHCNVLAEFIVATCPGEGQVAAEPVRQVTFSTPEIFELPDLKMPVLL
jgi:hypothetical protein